MKIIRTVVTAAIAGALALAPTAAFGYGAADYSNLGTASTTTPVVGQPVTITVQGPPGANVILTFTTNPASIPDSRIQIAGTRSLTKTADGAGSIVFTATLLEAGTYTGVVTDAVSGEVLSTQTFVVRAAPGATPTPAAAGGQLSATGSNALPIALGAGALVLLGAGGVVYANKRRQGANV